LVSFRHPNYSNQKRGFLKHCLCAWKPLTFILKKQLLVLPKKLAKFNEDEKSFKEFSESINNTATKQSYTYSLNELMRYHKCKTYDKLASLDGKQIQDLLL